MLWWNFKLIIPYIWVSTYNLLKQNLSTWSLKLCKILRLNLIHVILQVCCFCPKNSWKIKPSITTMDFCFQFCDIKKLTNLFPTISKISWIYTPKKTHFSKIFPINFCPKNMMKRFRLKNSLIMIHNHWSLINWLHEDGTYLLCKLKAKRLGKPTKKHACARKANEEGFLAIINCFNFSAFIFSCSNSILLSLSKICLLTCPPNFPKLITRKKFPSFDFPNLKQCSFIKASNIKCGIQHCSKETT